MGRQPVLVSLVWGLVILSEIELLQWPRHDKAVFTALPKFLCLQCFDTVGWAAGMASGL